MAQSFTTDELKSLFSFPFRAPNWKNKFLIGSLITLAGYVIPIVPFFFLYGYAAQIMRRIMVEGGEPFLPEWDDWGKLFTDGAKVVGVGFIYMLPLILLFVFGYGLMFVGVFVPAILAGEQPNSDSLTPLLGLVSVIGVFGWMGLFGLGMLYGLIGSVIVPAAIGHVITTGEFAAGFRWREWWPIFRANLAGFLVTYALLIGFSMVLSLVFQILYLTIIFCCLYPFVTAPVAMYISVIWGVLFARAYRDGAQKLTFQAANP
jgi:hypothetical protein